MSINKTANKKAKKLLVNGFYLLSVLLLLFVGIVTFSTMPTSDYSVLMVTGNFVLFLCTVFLSSKLLYNAAFSKGLRYKHFSVLGISALGFSLNPTLLHSLQQSGSLVTWYFGVILFLALLYNYILVPTTTKGILIGGLVALLSVVVPHSHIQLVLIVIFSLFIFKQNNWKYRFQALVPIAISIIIGVNVFWNIDFIDTFATNFPQTIQSETKLLFVFLLIHTLIYLTIKPTKRHALYVLSFLLTIAITVAIPHFLSYQQHSLVERVWRVMLMSYPVLFYAAVLSFDARLETENSFRSLVTNVVLRSSIAVVISLIVWFFVLK
jgi:hypothetical protein